jgi:hypothetical protein
MPKFTWFGGLGRVGTFIANALAILATNWVVVVSVLLALWASLEDWATAFVTKPSTQTFLIVFLALLWTSIGLVVLADRRKPREVRATQDYRYGLTFEGVVPLYNPTENEGTLALGITLRNYSSGPIRYDIDSLDLRIGTRSLPKVEKGILYGHMARGAGRTSMPAAFNKSDIAEFMGKRPTGTLEVSILYGHPEHPPVRRLRIIFDLLFVFSETNLGFSANIKEEKDEPLSSQ